MFKCEFVCFPGGVGEIEGRDRGWERGRDQGRQGSRCARVKSLFSLEGCCFFGTKASPIFLSSLSKLSKATIHPPFFSLKKVNEVELEQAQARGKLSQA